MPLLDRATELGGEGLLRYSLCLPFIPLGGFPFKLCEDPDTGGVITLLRLLLVPMAGE